MLIQNYDVLVTSGRVFMSQITTDAFASSTSIIVPCLNVSAFIFSKDKGRA